MKALFAIIKLTLRNAVRSHIFQLLLGVLILCVALVPTTVGGSTAMDFIRVSLLYSLSGIGAILSFSALWVGCHVMSADIDSYQLHMVVSKPVSRVTIWIGKYLGVLMLHLVLLAFAAAAIYGVVMWRFYSGGFSEQERARIEEERTKIENEVLVGRRVFLPERRNYAELANDLKDDRIRKQLADGRRKDPNVSPSEQERIYKECLKQLIAEDSEVDPANYVVTLPDGSKAIKFDESKYRTWVFKNVPPDAARVLYLRYRPFVGKVRSEDQRKTAVGWFIYVPMRGGAGQDESGGDQRFPIYLPRSEVMGGEFSEIPLRGDVGIVSPKGEVRIGAYNFDGLYLLEERIKNGQQPLSISPAKHYYQPVDGPKLLIKVTGFFGNYLRAVLVLALQLAMMAMLSCAFGGAMTLPTAVFVSICYLLLGFVSSFITAKDYYVNNALDRVGQWTAWRILDVVVPLERFDVTDLLADGELVEWSLIWNITWSCLLLRALPLALIGIFFYWRREFGLEIKK